MTLTERIEKMTMEASIYGKQKSGEYKKMIKQVMDATDDKELTSILKSMEVKFKGKLITQGEMMDILDKIDKKKQIGGGKLKKMKPRKFK